MADEPENHEKHQQELDLIEDAVSGIPLPLQYSEQHYNLRAHIEYVQRRLTSSSKDEG